MVYFVSTFRVPLLLWTLLASTNANKIKGHLPDVGIISSFLEQFIKPYIETIQVNSSKPHLRSNEKSKIEKVIRLKVADLKPMLEDSEDNDKPKVETENNLTLEGNEETTIIEFMPKKSKKTKKGQPVLRGSKQEIDPFQKNINKYKQLRKNIKKMLDKENTASSTKKLITRTLDEMLAQLIERQCTWKSVNTSGLKNHLFKNHISLRKSMDHLQKLTDKDWMVLRKQYMHFLKAHNDNADSVMQEFHDFFSKAINDTWYLANRYKVRCQLVKREDNSDVNILRENKIEEKTTIICEDFKVCSDELKDFLTKFYSDLNDTAVSTFRNYAAMYVRDVKAEIGDKDIVVSVLENLSNTAEKKVNKIFRKELENLKLDENKKKGSNIQHIKDFITATKDQVKTVLKKILDYELGAMKTKLFATVKDDLNVNMKLDMDNMGLLFVDRICTFFVLCNRKYGGRRSANRPKDTENVYVKVQLTLDDELKDSIARLTKQKPWGGKDMTYRSARNFAGIDQMRYSYINVTRTTSVGTTNKTTLSTPLPIKEITANLKGMTISVKNYI